MNFLLYCYKTSFVFLSWKYSSRFFPYLINFQCVSFVWLSFATTTKNHFYHSPSTDKEAIHIHVYVQFRKRCNKYIRLVVNLLNHVKLMTFAEMLVIRILIRSFQVFYRHSFDNKSWIAYKNIVMWHLKIDREFQCVERSLLRYQKSINAYK